MKRNKSLSREQKHIMKDAAVFAAKLWVDGIKDFVLAIVALCAAALDVIRGKGDEGYLFYKVMRTGQKIDHALDLYGTGPPPDVLEPSDRDYDKYTI
ncbi:MAG TPA: hypothetical protein VM100_05040 [Longimicrobiales bacterium]|nr:hypothetical protein [Longimicrobiales bacterium]